MQELQIANDLSTSGKNILIVHYNKTFAERSNKRIDIWWRGEDTNGDLMLLLSYLIRLNRKWKKAVINIFSVADSEKERLALKSLIQYSIKKARINAEIYVLIKDNDDVVGMLIKNSLKADIVFCGLARDNSAVEKRIQTMERIVSRLNVVVFAQNNGMRMIFL